MLSAGYVPIADAIAGLSSQGCGAGSSSERTRSAITAALRKKLRDLMGEFQELRQRLQDEYRHAHTHAYALDYAHSFPSIIGKSVLLSDVTPQNDSESSYGSGQ